MLIARSRRPSYFLNFPGASITSDFVYNRFEPRERESSQLPENYNNNPDELARYVRVRMSIDNENFNGRNIHSVSSISPHIVGVPAHDPDGNRMPLIQMLPIGQPIIPGQIGSFKDQIVDQASYMSQQEHNIMATDFFLSRRLNLKAKIIAEDYDIDLNSEEGITRALGENGVLNNLSQQSKDLFLDIKSSEVVPGITMVNDVSSLLTGDPLVKESALNIPIKIDAFNGEAIIDDLFYTTPRGLMVFDTVSRVRSSEMPGGDDPLLTGNPVFSMETQLEGRARDAESRLDGVPGRRDDTAEILAHPIVSLNKGVLGTVIVQNQVDKDGQVLSLFDYDNGEIENIDDWESPLVTRFSSGLAASSPMDAYSVLHVGYIVTRRSTDSSLKREDFVKKYYVDLKKIGSMGGIDRQFGEADGGMFPVLESTAEFIDHDVLYGVSYSYSCEPVFLITSQESIDAPTGRGGEFARNMNEYLISSYLVSGVSNNLSYCKIIDDIAPDPPENLFFRLHDDGLFLDWQPPNNPQGDIKYFQVFRRRTIEEPYTCIAMLDFDNSTVKTASPERVIARNIMKYPSMKSCYKDYSFKHGDRFMYAVCAVDAHGLTSGYSIQCEVSLDKDGRSPLRVRRVSKIGAPKQYPNFYIDPEMSPDVAANSITQDYMGTSGKKQVDIYFDPDAQEVHFPIYNNSVENELIPRAEQSVSHKYYSTVKIFDTVTISRDNIDLSDLFNRDISPEVFEDPGCKYIFNFMSIDRQKSDNLEIFLLQR